MGKSQDFYSESLTRLKSFTDSVFIETDGSDGDSSTESFNSAFETIEMAEGKLKQTGAALKFDLDQSDHSDQSSTLTLTLEPCQPGSSMDEYSSVEQIPLPRGGSSADKETFRLKHENDSLKKEVVMLCLQIEEKSKWASSLQSKLNATTSIAGTLKNERDTLKEEIDLLNNKVVEKLKSDIANLTTQADEYKKKISTLSSAVDGNKKESMTQETD